MSDLDKMFGEYEDKLKREREEKEQQKAKANELQKSSSETLRAIVLPVLKELSLKINEKGYKSSVSELIDNHVYPHVQLNFTPNSKGGSFTNSSTLRFAHTESGQIEMKEEIKAGEGKSFSGYYDPNSKIEPSKISEDWVRQKAMSFIEKVLKAA